MVKIKTKSGAGTQAIGLPFVGSIVYMLKGMTSPSCTPLYPLSVIVGPVEAGKTTLLDAIRLGLMPELRQDQKLLAPLLNPVGEAKSTLLAHIETTTGLETAPISAISVRRESARKWDTTCAQTFSGSESWIPGLSLKSAVLLGPDLLRRAIFRRFGVVKGDPIERTAKALVTAHEKAAMIKLLTLKRPDGSDVALPEDPAEALVALIERADAAMREAAGAGRRLTEEAQRAKGEAVGHEAGDEVEKRKPGKQKGKAPLKISAIAAMEVLKSPDGHKLCASCIQQLDRAAKAATPTDIARGAYRDIETTTRLAREIEVEHVACESIKKLLRAELLAAEDATFEAAEDAVNAHLPKQLRAKVLRVERGVRWAIELHRRSAERPVVDLAALSGWERGCLAIAIPLAFASSDQAPLILLDDEDVAGCSVFEMRALLTRLAERQKEGRVRQVIITRHDDRAAEVPQLYQAIRLGGA